MLHEVWLLSKTKTASLLTKYEKYTLQNKLLVAKCFKYDKIDKLGYLVCD